MNKRLNRVLDEIQKTEEKIAEWQEHLRELNILREQLENQEIVKSVRSLKLDSRKMLELMDAIQNGTISVGSIGVGMPSSDAEKRMDTDMPERAEQKRVPKHADTAPEREDYNEET